MLEFKSVSRIFPDGTIGIDNVSLDIKRGEFCVLLGPSGAGKSTLMSMVNGMSNPDKGEVIFNGEPVRRRNLKQIQKQVGMIHQQLHLIPRLSVLHNVLSGLLPSTPFWRSLIKAFPRDQQRKACHLLEEVELEERHLYRRVSTLSGGQQQRVAIARAFMMEPITVLADEPVASLDPTISRSILDLLKRAAQHHNASVLCSLHQVEYAMEFADRIIGLRNGKMIYNGHPGGLSESILADLYRNRGAKTSDSAQQSIPQPLPAMA